MMQPQAQVGRLNFKEQLQCMCSLVIGAHNQPIGSMNAPVWGSFWWASYGFGSVSWSDEQIMQLRSSQLAQLHPADCLLGWPFCGSRLATCSFKFSSNKFFFAKRAATFLSSPRTNFNHFHARFQKGAPRRSLKDRNWLTTGLSRRCLVVEVRGSGKCRRCKFDVGTAKRRAVKTKSVLCKLSRGLSL